MLIDAERSILLVVDLQEKMVPALAKGRRWSRNAVWLIRVAQKLGVPVVALEQYPKGLGHVVAAVRDLLPADAIASKTASRASPRSASTACPRASARQVVVCGAETHVCVLQSALDLAEDGKDVFVVADAVGSRRPFDRDIALARMRDERLRVVTREMVAFEWLRQAGTPLFREINKLLLR